MVKLGIAPNLIEDYKFPCYVCYLIIMNGDSSKEIILLGLMYLATWDSPAVLIIYILFVMSGKLSGVF